MLHLRNCICENVVPFYRLKISIGYSLIRSLSNNDENDDVNENGKKQKV